MENKNTSLLLIRIVLIFYLSLLTSDSYACVTLTVGDGFGSPGSQGNPVKVMLDNQNYKVGGIELDICDVDNYLTCTACENTERISGFRCTINERENGCCGVTIVSDSGALIEKGTGPLFILKYDVSEGAPGGGCRSLDPENENVLDELRNVLAVNKYSGKFCFFICGDMYPEESHPGASDCGEGAVDIFDVIEAIDIALGIGAHSNCQLSKADLPTGTPPHCLDPDGIVDIFDIQIP